MEALSIAQHISRSLYDVVRYLKARGGNKIDKRHLESKARRTHVRANLSPTVQTRKFKRLFALAGGEREFVPMQDDSHIDTNPRAYGGGKWQRQTTSAAETAKTALEAGSVTVKQGARKLAEQQKQAGADQIG